MCNTVYVDLTYSKATQFLNAYQETVLHNATSYARVPMVAEHIRRITEIDESFWCAVYKDIGKEWSISIISYKHREISRFTDVDKPNYVYQ